MKVDATEDIPEGVLSELREYLSERGEEVRSRRIMLASTDPPSFIQVVADYDTLKAVIGFAASAFASTLSACLAKDLYGQKEALASRTLEAMKNISDGIYFALSNTPRNTFLKFELAAPRGVPNPSISFLVESEEEIRFKMACVYALHNRIIGELSECASQADGKVTPPRINVEENGDIRMAFYRGINNEPVDLVISLLE